MVATPISYILLRPTWSEIWPDSGMVTNETTENLVERFFADLTADMIRSGSFASIGELVRDVDAYLSDRNAAPMLYTWRPKAPQSLRKSTADDGPSLQATAACAIPAAHG